MATEKDRRVGVTPLNTLRKLMGGELARAPILATLDFNLAEVQTGFAVFTGTLSFEHYHPLTGG